MRVGQLGEPVLGALWKLIGLWHGGPPGRSAKPPVLGSGEPGKRELGPGKLGVLVWEGLRPNRGPAEHVQELGVALLGPADILGPYPAADDTGNEHEGTDDNGCGPCGKGRPLNVNEGESPSRLIDGVFRDFILWGVQSLHTLKLSELSGIALTVRAGARDDDHLVSSSFFFYLCERRRSCGDPAEDETGGVNSPSC